MSFREFMKRPQTLFRLGLLAMASTGVLRTVFHPKTRGAEDLYDGLYGLLIGISIGSLLLWMVKKRRSSSGR